MGRVTAAVTGERIPSPARWHGRPVAAEPVAARVAGALGMLLSLGFPARCAGCRSWGAVLCHRCAATLRAPRPLPPPAGLDTLVACFAYEGALRELIARAKYRNERAGLDLLAEVMAARAAMLRPPLELVTFPPTTPARRRARGFDQAQLLARRVGGHLDLPVVTGLRRRTGPAQTGLPGALRRVGPSFVPRARLPDRVLLVDDVCTTGATLRHAAAAVRMAGARHVVGVVAARRDPRC